jgi:hypothetical protein
VNDILLIARDDELGRKLQDVNLTLKKEPLRINMTTKGTNSRDVFVYADWDQINGPLFMGRLHAELLRGKEVFSFEHDQDWLQSALDR